MNCAVYEIKMTPAENYYFTFKSPDEKSYIISKSFGSRAGLEKCLSEIREAAPLAQINTEPETEGKPPYFLIHKRQEEYGFSLIGYENEVIFSSVFYQEKSACTEAIRELKDYAQTAVISDMTRTVHTQKNAGNCGKEGLY